MHRYIQSLAMLIFAITTFALTGTGLAQEDQAADELRAQQIIKVFRLQSASSELAAEVIRTMVDTKDFRLATDPRSNDIIVAGTEEQLKVVEAILRKLDEGKEKATPTIMALKHVPADDAMKIISKQFQNTEDLKVASDPRQNWLLITATKSVMEKVAEFIRVIDQPVSKGQLANKNVLIYTYWIVDQEVVTKDHPDWQLREVPDSIQKLVKDKLARRTSMRKPMMAANLAIQASVGESASESSAIQNTGHGKIDKNHSFEIEMQGQLWNSPESGSKIDFELEMLVALKGIAKPAGASAIQTKISTPLDHPVCLGVTPVNGMDSILIIEIVEAD